MQRKNFFNYVCIQFPLEALHSKQLDSNDKIIFMVLTESLAMEGDDIPSGPLLPADMAELCGLSAQAAARSLSRLKSRGLAYRLSMMDQRSGRGQAGSYVGRVVHELVVPPTPKKPKAKVRKMTVKEFMLKSVTSN